MNRGYRHEGSTDRGLFTYFRIVGILRKAYDIVAAFQYHQERRCAL
jgi:hypothetical protein